MHKSILAGRLAIVVLALVAATLIPPAPAGAASVTARQGSGAVWDDAPGRFFQAYVTSTGQTPVDGGGRWLFQGVVRDVYPCSGETVWVSAASWSTGEGMVAGYVVMPDNSGVKMGRISGYLESDCLGYQPFVLTFEVNTVGAMKSETDVNGTDNWIRTYKDQAGAGTKATFQWDPGGSRQTTTIYDEVDNLVSEAFVSTYV